MHSFAHKSQKSPFGPRAFAGPYGHKIKARPGPLTALVRSVVLSMKTWDLGLSKNASAIALGLLEKRNDSIDANCYFSGTNVAA